MTDSSSHSDNTSTRSGGAGKGVTRGRRMTFGMNAALTVAAVLVIVVFANWIAARHAENWRFDWTAMGRYSLSPQTQRVLDNLEQPVEVVTLFAEGVGTDERTLRRIRRFRDLLDEYDRRSGGRVSVEHVSAGDAEREQRLYERVAERFEQDIADGRKAIENAVAVIERIPGFASELTGAIEQQQARLDADDAGTADVLRQLLGVYRPYAEDPQTAAAAAEVHRRLDEPLPNYGDLLETTRQTLRDFRASHLTPTLDELRRIIEDDSRSPRARDVAGTLRPIVQRMLDRVNEQLQTMEGLDFTGYRSAVRTIRRSDSATILGPDEVIVLDLEDLYLQTATAAEDDASSDRARFRGEEAVTGALLSLSMDNPPKVVFVNPLSVPATGPRGLFSHVAERLAALNVEVSEYNPTRTEQPRPEAEEGQARVWVMLPSPPMDRRNPQASMRIQQAMGRFVESLGQSDNPSDARTGLVVLLNRNPMARFGQNDPVANLLNDFGIEVAADRLLLREVFLPDGRQMPTSQLDLSRWPDGNPISRALRGLSVTFANAVPLTVQGRGEGENGDGGSAGSGGEGNGDGDGQASVVAEAFTILATGETVWAERDVDNRTQLPRANEGERRGPIPVAAGAERDNRRLVAFSSLQFAMDDFVLTRQPVATAEGIEMIEAVQRPGNVELMLNSIHWAAGLDELIATGARSQDVRRWQQIDEATYTGLMWLLIAGLPVATLLVGVGVWSVRRR